MQLKIILSFLTILSLAFLVPSDVFGAWYDTEVPKQNYGFIKFCNIK